MTAPFKIHENQTVADLNQAQMSLIQDLRNHQTELVAQNEELRSVQQELQMSRDKYSSLYELAPVGYFTHHRGGVVTESNQMFAELVGASPSELSQATFHSFVVGEFQDAFYLHCKAVLADHRRHVCELKVARKNGSVFFARLESIAIRSSATLPTDILTSLCDVSNTKDAEEKLRLASEKSEEANLSKSAFLANMSHEIRTPLSAILGFTLMLFEKDLDFDSRRNCADKIKNNGEHLLHLIEDILDLSKVESGNLALESTAFSMSNDLAPFIKGFRIAANARGLTFRVTNDGPIPELIYTDPLRLKQILFNIVGNAIKFTDQGEVCLNLKVTKSLLQESSTSVLEFIVSDTGLGMSSSQCENTFKLFTQADASITRKFGGSGLGLVLSRTLATALGGNVVMLSSALGAGSKFKITLDVGTAANTPLLANLPFNEPLKHEVSAVESKRGLLKKVRVLVAEDSRDIQFLINHFLKYADATVELAVNGKEALEMAQVEPYDVVFMDIQMPILDGYQATEMLRQQGYCGPIIALTANAMKGQRELCLKAVFDDYLSKPVNFEKLIDTASMYAKQGASHRAKANVH